MLKIQFLDRRQPAFWLVDPRLTIGRDKSNGLVINDEGVSVFHAELQQEDGKLYLRDAGSVNGTFLNDQPVSQRIEVNVGDVIRLHLVELQIIDPTKAPPEGAPQIKRDLGAKQVPVWQVKAMTGVISGRMFPIEGTKVVGRDPHCDIVVGGAHVSRRHAEFSIRSGQLWLKDLGSSNGSFINGKRHEEIQLKNGDEVRLDAMTFKVVGPTEPVAVEDNFEEEAERTQFRPVAGAGKAAPAPAAQSRNPSPLPQHAAPKPSAPVSAPEPRPAPQANHAAPSAPATPASASKSNVGMIVTVVLIVVGVLMALFLL
ncbi:pSer/pThr/pTyr-binding forkhead associated (FHA) protein [Fluviicoccus keumensis]|uniref:PSer/pThr/pTyr-binding forkhead associated (FHA) protein n=1 Tax=Fluviicoccus keumensis TaxID=1435465 RepID=A0A4V6MFQ5_9GAMM|nr:FHA domain-containing protein [Fluviicoccus keumensis]RZU36946.1 pSer/pThr/pTyr-binding forkhead associated (FHA) protein [Fluviicoccus keumensis]